MIDPVAIRAKADTYQAEDPDCGRWTALKLAAVEAIIRDTDGASPGLYDRLDRVFDARGWEIEHVIARMGGGL